MLAGKYLEEARVGPALIPESNYKNPCTYSFYSAYLKSCSFGIFIMPPLKLNCLDPAIPEDALRKNTDMFKDWAILPLWCHGTVWRHVVLFVLTESLKQICCSKIGTRMQHLIPMLGIQRKNNLFEFQDGLVNIVCSRMARTTQWDPDSQRECMTNFLWKLITISYSWRHFLTKRCIWTAIIVYLQ